MAKNKRKKKKVNDDDSLEAMDAKRRKVLQVVAWSAILALVVTTGVTMGVTSIFG